MVPGTRRRLRKIPGIFASWCGWALGGPGGCSCGRQWGSGRGWACLSGIVGARELALGSVLGARGRTGLPQNPQNLSLSRAPFLTAIGAPNLDLSWVAPAFWGFVGLGEPLGHSWLSSSVGDPVMQLSSGGPGSVLWLEAEDLEGMGLLRSFCTPAKRRNVVEPQQGRSEL